MNRQTTTFITAALLASLAPHQADANAYKILGVKSARATAMGEAFIVRADDPSAIAFNPAGLAQQRGTHLSIQSTFCNAYTTHTAPDGRETDIIDAWQPVPAFFLSSDFGSDRIGAGIGVTVPNGLSSEWGRDSFARYVATYSELTVVDISPAIGVNVTDSLSLGAGLNIYYSEAQLDRMMDAGLAAGAPGAFDLASSLQGEGSAVSFNIGGIWKLSDAYSIGLVYRHPYTIEYDGDLSVAGNTMPLSVDIDFPRAVIGGVAFRPSDAWAFELNIDWTQWDEVEDYHILFENAAIPSATQIQQLENTLAYKVGAEYAWSDSLALRAGYIYNQNATPEAHWRPSLPNTDTHFLSAGFGLELSSLTLEGTLSLVFYEERTIDNNVDNNELLSSSSVDGTYETFAPCFSLAATYHF